MAGVHSLPLGKLETIPCLHAALLLDAGELAFHVIMKSFQLGVHSSARQMLFSFFRFRQKKLCAAG